MKILRTPDACFEGLMTFEPHYQMVPDGEGGELRIHYLDEGPRDGEVIVCMHGQPTWSYLYRKMIPLFVEAGYRVLAPCLVGYGRSDKPSQQEDYTYKRQVTWMDAWYKAVGLENVTLVCQDWGGLIGLRIVANNPDMFARVVVANTGLPDAHDTPDEMAGPMRAMRESVDLITVDQLAEKFAAKDGPPAFFYWQKMCAEAPDLPIAKIVNGDPAYDAPFPDDSYKAAPRKFPSLVPLFPDDPAIGDNRAAWKALGSFDKPFLTAFSDRDPVTKGGHVRFQKEVPGAQGQEHVTIEGGGHFLQEDKGPELAKVVIKFMANNPLS